MTRPVRTRPAETLHFMVPENESAASGIAQIRNMKNGIPTPTDARWESGGGERAGPARTGLKTVSH